MRRIAKNILSIALSITLLLASVPGVIPMVQAETVGDYEYSVFGGGAYVTKYNGNAATLSIPATLGDIPVTGIGENAFAGCTSLTSVAIPDSVISISEGAFWGCTSLTSVTIPDNVTHLDIRVFIGCTSLTSLYIGRGVSNIFCGYDGGVFNGCTSLADISVSLDNPYLSSENGVLFNKDKTELLFYPQGKPDKTYSIPKSVTKFTWEAFEECKFLTALTIPKHVTEISKDGHTNYPNLIIYCKKGSFAHKYAERKNILYGFGKPGSIGNNTVAVGINSQSKGSTVKKNKTLILKVKADLILKTKAALGMYGKLSYQWYSNTKKNAKGGTKIKGATKNSYRVPTEKKGVKYYRCVITNIDKMVKYQKTVTVRQKSGDVKVKVK